MDLLKKTVLLLLFSASFSVAFSQKSYKNFKVSVYSRSYETKKMADPKWIEPVWNEISNQVKVDKIYLETHRDLVIVDQKTLDAAKLFFKKRGVETAGGSHLQLMKETILKPFVIATRSTDKK
jgi:hypothetical protein